MELVSRGSSAVPALLEVLERRDVDLRRQAVDILRKIVGGEVDFDPHAPENQRRQQLAQDPAYVEDVLRDGAKRARAVAQETMALVREAVGMLPRSVG